MPRHIVKGDTVIVTAGSAKGSVGEVIRVLPDEDRVVVSGVNVRNKRIPRSQQNPQGGSIRAEAANPYLECQPRGRRQAQPRPV